MVDDVISFLATVQLEVSSRYCQLEAKSPVFETKSSNSRTVNQQLKDFCGQSKRQRMAQVDNTRRTQTVLVVLFVPSVERDRVTSIDQQYWVDSALEFY
jgi:hypothetical protein